MLLVRMARRYFNSSSLSACKWKMGMIYHQDIVINTYAVSKNSREKEI